MKKFLLYLLRWQLSTPVLWFVITYISIDNYLVKTILANLIGGIIFFWVDSLIFKERPGYSHKVKSLDSYRKFKTSEK